MGFNLGGMMKTATSTLTPYVSLRHRAWSAYRNQPFVAVLTMTAAVGIFGFATIEDKGFWPCLPMAIALFATVFNMFDLTTRVYDHGHRKLGFVLALGCAAGAGAIAYAALLMLIMWSYLPN